MPSGSTRGSHTHANLRRVRVVDLGYYASPTNSRMRNPDRWANRSYDSGDIEQACDDLESRCASEIERGDWLGIGRRVAEFIRARLPARERLRRLDLPELPESSPDVTDELRSIATAIVRLVALRITQGEVTGALYSLGVWLRSAVEDAREEQRIKHAEHSSAVVTG